MFGIFTLFCTGYVSYKLNKPFSLNPSIRRSLLFNITEKSLLNQTDPNFLWIIFYNSQLVSIEKNEFRFNNICLIDVKNFYKNLDEYLPQILNKFKINWAFDLDSDDAISKTFIEKSKSKIKLDTTFDAFVVFSKFLYILKTQNIFKCNNPTLNHAWFKPSKISSYNHREHWKFFKQLNYKNINDHYISYLITCHTDHVNNRSKFIKLTRIGNEELLFLKSMFPDMDMI